MNKIIYPGQFYVSNPLSPLNSKRKGSLRRLIARILDIILALLLSFFLLLCIPCFLHQQAPDSNLNEKIVPVTSVLFAKKNEHSRQQKMMQPHQQDKIIRQEQHPAPHMAIMAMKKISMDLPPLAVQNEMVLDIPATGPSSATDAALAAPQLPNIFTVEDLDHPLLPLSQPPPIYPFNAKQRKIEGKVKVRFIVTTTGEVNSIKIMEATPQGIFEQSVIRCLSNWHFKPGTIEGHPVNCWAETTIKFILQ